MRPELVFLIFAIAASSILFGYGVKAVGKGARIRAAAFTGVATLVLGIGVGLMVS